MASEAIPHLMLEPGVIHVMRTHVDAPPLAMAELAAAVTEGERERAARYIHARDQKRHIIGRGILRLALSRLTGTHPTSIRLHTNDLGKPFMEGGPSFSISHSGEEILIAIAPDGRLGVDVEAVRTLRNLAGLARTSFTSPEVETVIAYPEAVRLRAFFRVWTRKEAMLKALGCGLTGLRAIRVAADEGGHNALLEMREPPELERWTVQSIAVDPAVEAAVAWDHPVVRVDRIDL